MKDMFLSDILSYDREHTGNIISVEAKKNNYKRKGFAAGQLSVTSNGRRSIDKSQDTISTKKIACRNPKWKKRTQSKNDE